MSESEHVSLDKPIDFFPKVAVVGCFFNCEDKILLLKRSPTTSHSNTWGVPAGKVENGETLREALVREVLEEVGIVCDNECLDELGTLYVRFPDSEFTFHIFEQKLPHFPTITLSHEHLDYRFVTAEEAFKLPLIRGGSETLNYYFTENS